MGVAVHRGIAGRRGIGRRPVSWRKRAQPARDGHCGLRRRGLPSIADEELSMRQNRALVTAVPPAGPEIIRHYHAHVYYDPVSSRGRAARLRERVAAAFPDATLGRWHDVPVGPHPQSMYQIAFPTTLLASFLPWLMLNRDGLNILLHPS